jgi:hypothetical protein
VAWSRVQSAGANGTAGNPSVSYTSNLSSGTVLIAAVSAYNNAVTAVADSNGNAFTKIGTVDSNAVHLSLWALATPSGDAGTKPAVNATTSASYWAMVIQEISGIQAAVDGTAGTAYANSAGSISPSYSSTAASEYLVTCYGDDGESTAATLNTSGWTLDTGNQLGNTNMDCGIAYKNSTGGAESDGWTGAGANEAAIMVAFKLPASSNSGPFTPVLPAPAATLSGKTGHAGPLPVTMPKPAATLSGKPGHAGPFTPVLRPPAATLSGKTGHAGPFTPVLPAPVTSLTWPAAFILPRPVTGLSGKLDHVDQMTLILPRPSTSLTTSPVISAMSLYNLAVNPSFEASTAGWTATAGAVLTQTGVTAYSGRYCAQVTTDGLHASEGVYGPAWQFTSASPLSVQLRVAGSAGTLQVSVAKNPGGIILATQAVQLANDWTAVQFPGLAASANDSVYVIIVTASAEAVTFYLDAVMYEPAAAPDPYFDGDTQGASWLGQPGLSASVLPQPGALSLHGGMFMAGRLSLISEGQVSQVTPPSGQAVMSGAITAVTGTSPPAALDDFASWETGTDYDPAMTYVTWNTAGMLSGHSGYTRPWAIFYPPLDYPDSTGANLWNRAAFAAAGFEYASVGPGAAQNLTCVQLEMMPLAGANSLDETPAPSTYDPSRTVHAIIKPARLNYAQNPAFQVTGYAWYAAGNGTLTYDPTVIFPLGGSYDGQQLATLTQSGMITVSSGYGGCAQQLEGLFTGDLYIASMYVMPGPGIADFQLTAGSGVSASIATPGGADLQPGTWYRIYVIFTAPAPAATLAVTAIPGQDADFPVTFHAGPCLVEAGAILGEYFDGSFSDPDYMWESGSQPGAGRSYYYPDYAIQQDVVLDILARHTPLGLTWAPPLYAVLPTQ